MVVVVVSVRWNVKRYAGHTVDGSQDAVCRLAISVAPPIRPSLSYPYMPKVRMIAVVTDGIRAEICTRECEFGLYALQ